MRAFQVAEHGPPSSLQFPFGERPAAIGLIAQGKVRGKAVAAMDLQDW